MLPDAGGAPQLGNGYKARFFVRMPMSDASQLPPFETLSRETVADCRVFRVERLHRRSGRTGQVHEYFHIAARDWVNVVALTDMNELVLVRQERHGTEALSLELPGGVIDPGETQEQAALRELREETGFAGTEAISLGWVHPNPALQHNRCFTYLVRGTYSAGPPAPHGCEEIEVELLPLGEVHRRIVNGAISHALTVSGLMLLQLQVKE